MPENEEKLSPIVVENNPHAKTMDEATGKRNLKIVAISFGASYLLCAAVLIAGLVLRNVSTSTPAEATLTVDYRAGLYDANHVKLADATFTYTRPEGQTYSELALVELPEGDYQTLVLPRYEQESLETSVRTVTRTANLPENENILGKTPLDLSISEIVAGSYMTTIGRNSFSNLTSLTAIRGGFYESQLTILDRAFYGCTALTDFPFASGTSFIGVSAFENTAIVDLDLSETRIREIDDRAFAGLKGATSVALPSHLSTLGEAIFASSSVTSVTYDGTLASFGAIEGIENAFANSQITSVACTDGTYTIN